MRLHPFPIKLHVTTEEDAYRKKVKKLRGVPEEVTPDISGYTHTFGAHVVVLVLPPKSENDGFNVSVHEAVHVWQHIVDFIQEEAPGKEVEAYMIAYISELIHAKLSPPKKKKKAKPPLPSLSTLIPAL